ERLGHQINTVQHGDHGPLKTMVDLGSQFYVQAHIPDSAYIFVQVGFGFHVQFTLDEAQQFIGKKVQRLKIFILFFNMMAPRPCRWLDFVFFTFFLTHIPITLFFDLQALYPTSWVPEKLLAIVAWYVDITCDPFMDPLNDMYWFKSLATLEGIFQLPFFFVACYGLYYGKDWIRLPLIVYGAHVVTTVMPIVLELTANASLALTVAQRGVLLSIYSPYLIIPAVMLVDAYRQVSVQLFSMPEE
ncbi:hypothetical protein DM01DRAFT_1296239, partial [Hesseltinella vesiculosa]